MNRFEQPPVMVGTAGPDADDLDGLLRRYFQSQMPDPWPASLRPTLTFPAASHTRLPWRSRLTLAASVACLLLGSVWFVARAPQPTANTTPNVEEATRRNHLHHPKTGEPLELPASRPHR